MKKNAFTLIELVVVITIMMVITAIGVVSFSGLNKRSRDSKRMSDLEKIAIALEIYKQEIGIYPASKGSLVSDYVEAIPTDPKNYTYYYDPVDDYSYYLYAYMEDVGSTTGDYGNWCSGEANCNYRIASP